MYTIYVGGCENLRGYLWRRDGGYGWFKNIAEQTYLRKVKAHG